MNIFYAPPSQIQEKRIELTGQEAIHATKALRYSTGDQITVVDGLGGWYKGKIQTISGKTVQIAVQKNAPNKDLQPNVILAIGIIKKRDRLEFAVEKAVELGVKAIALFRSEHTVKQNVRLDRLQTISLSAMKQSLQAWLPKIQVFNNPDEVIAAYPFGKLMVAHETEKRLIDHSALSAEGDALLLVGPEGGFSEHEINKLRKKKAVIVSLGKNRLRTETAAITFMNQYYYLRLANQS